MDNGVGLGVITIAKITSPGHYMCWSGWYGHGPMDIQPIMDWTLLATSDEELSGYDVYFMEHVTLPAGV